MSTQDTSGEQTKVRNERSKKGLTEVVSEQGVVYEKDEDDLECPWRQVHYELLRESDEWDVFTQRWHKWARTREVHDAWFRSEFRRCTSVGPLAPKVDEGGRMSSSSPCLVRDPVSLSPSVAGETVVEPAAT